MDKIWRLNINKDNNELDMIVQSHGVNKIIASILHRRGNSNYEEIDKFLNPKLKYLHSPKLMKDMDKGTDVVISAIKQKKKIVVYGDYDCDGVTSTTIMYKGLLRCGAYVYYHIPDRIEEGYGMNNETIKRLVAEGFEVIVTCDNGISSIGQVDLAKGLGMQVVVTDHHEVPFLLDANGTKREVLPEADAVINPKRQDCDYPFKNLCGAGVAFKFIHTLYYKMGIDTKELMDFIEIAAIGTICDVVDLVDENRIIVSMGLRMLNSTKNIGIRALVKEVGYEGKRIKTGNIGFQIGPCINATGRLDSASLSVELLMCRDENKARELARELRRLNQERQELTEDALGEIIEQIEHSDIKNDKVLLVYKEDLNESLAGILAGRIRERYNKPAYVITKAKDGAKGSGRSIEEYNMFEEICKCKDLLIGAGGHPMAAGFSIAEENIPLFRNRLNGLCTLTEDDLVCKIDVDDIINMDDITFDLIDGLERLEPFGKGNREPVFIAEGLIVDRIYLMGKNKEHVKFLCRDKKSNISLPAVCFYQSDSLKELLAGLYGSDNVWSIIQNPESVKLKIDLLFKPCINDWNNTKTVQLQIVDYKLSE